MTASIEREGVGDLFNKCSSAGKEGGNEQHFDGKLRHTGCKKNQKLVIGGSHLATGEGEGASASNWGRVKPQ